MPGDHPITREQADRQGETSGTVIQLWPLNARLSGHSLGPAWRRPPCPMLILDLPLSSPRVDASAHPLPATSEHYKPQAPGSRSQLTASRFLATWTTALQTPPFPTTPRRAPDTMNLPSTKVKT